MLIIHVFSMFRMIGYSYSIKALNDMVKCYDGDDDFLSVIQRK